MNRVTVSFAGFDQAGFANAGLAGHDRLTEPPPWGKALGGFVRKVLGELGKDNRDISVLLCDDKTITEFNRRYRRKNEATDILSFVRAEGDCFPNPNRRLAAERRHMGDIAVSLDTLRENARRFGICEDEELRRLLIHGILHLDGMDHKTNKKTEPMLRLQEKILSDLKGQRILSKNGLSYRSESCKILCRVFLTTGPSKTLKKISRR